MTLDDYTTEQLKAAYEKLTPYYDGFSEKEEKDMSSISGAKYVYDSSNELVGLTDDGKRFFRFDTVRQLLDSDYHTVPISEEELRLVEPPKGTLMWLCEYACGLKDSDDYFIELGNPALGRSASVNEGKVVLTDKLIEAIELNYTKNKNTVSDLVGLCYVLDSDTGNLLGFADGISRGYTDLKGQKLPMPRNTIIQAIRTHDLIPVPAEERGLVVQILLVEGDQCPNGQSYQVATPYTPLSDTDKLFTTKKLRKAQNMLKLEDVVITEEALLKPVSELKGFGGDYDEITEEELIAEQEKNSGNVKSCDLLDAFGGEYNLIRTLKRPLINHEFVYAIRGYGLNDETYVPMVSKIGSVIDEGNGRFSLSLNAVEGSESAVKEMSTYYVNA